MQSLTFLMVLPRTPTTTLTNGYLRCEYDELVTSFLATSGSVGNQYKGSQHKIKKGCLPSHDQVGIKHYNVSTNGLWLSNVKGVEGLFFPISPFSVEINGVTRGDFGIHFDANVPGSAGCIVLRQKNEWQEFIKIMQQFNARRIKSVPLMVNYQ